MVHFVDLAHADCDDLVPVLFGGLLRVGFIVVGLDAATWSISHGLLFFTVDLDELRRLLRCGNVAVLGRYLLITSKFGLRSTLSLKLFVRVVAQKFLTMVYLSVAVSVHDAV